MLIFILGCGDSSGDSAIQPTDECGVINGAGAIYECGCDDLPICGSVPCCDCYGNVEDCDGVCGGPKIEDCTGVCGGDAVDVDEDGICDDSDDCIGEIDACSECNGPGIPENMQNEAFKPFFRLDHSRNSGTGGIGLGLTIARDIIRGHGGEIILDDSPSGGLRARLTLPI